MALPDRERWEAPEAAVTVLSTQLDGLANGTISAYSAAQAQTARYTRADFELLVTFGTAPTAGAFVGLYLVPVFDGVNDPTNHQDYGSHFAGAFPIRGVTTQQRVVLKDVKLPPLDFKVAAFNSTGQAFPASGSTVRMRRYAATIED